MVDRNTIVGIDFLTVGLAVAALGYIGTQSVPIAAFGFALAIIGALILLIVPETVPQDAFKALLKDSIRNVEMILEESQLKERAYFLELDKKEDGGKQIRAFVPLAREAERQGQRIMNEGHALIETLNKAPRRFITNFHGLQGVLLIPPGNEIVSISKVQKGDDLEEALRSTIVGFSDLAGSVLATEEDGVIRVQISNPKLTSNSPFFNECLGSPVSCVASCVAAAVKGEPVRIVEERFDRALVRLKLQVTT